MKNTIWDFVIVYVDCSENPICSEMERPSISDISIPKIEEQVKKVMELSEMEKWTPLIRENNISSFISSWKPLLDFAQSRKQRTLDIGFSWLFVVVELASICYKVKS